LELGSVAALFSRLNLVLKAAVVPFERGGFDAGARTVRVRPLLPLPMVWPRSLPSGEGLAAGCVAGAVPFLSQPKV